VSKTQFVEYRDRGFWAYDVALGVFLWHLIGAATTRVATANEQWLNDAISSWRVVACIGDYALIIDDSWSEKQIDLLVELTNEACNSLARREAIGSEEITSWPVLDDLRLHTRGATTVDTRPVIELGQAIIALVNNSLPAAPAGKHWLYGAPDGLVAI
jgi:hypothetical protein